MPVTTNYDTNKAPLLVTDASRAGERASIHPADSAALAAAALPAEPGQLGRQVPGGARALAVAGAAGQPAARARHHRQLRVLRLRGVRPQLATKTGLLLS